MKFPKYKVVLKIEGVVYAESVITALNKDSAIRKMKRLYTNSIVTNLGPIRYEATEV